MTKIRINVTQEIHRELTIDVEDYTGNEDSKIQDVCDLFHSISNDPMNYIDGCDDSNDEIGEITSRSITIVEEG